MLSRPGAADFGLVDECINHDYDKFLRYHIQLEEYKNRVLLPKLALKNGYATLQMSMITDLRGLGENHLWNLNAAMTIVQGIVTIGDRNYPEGLFKHYIINA